VFWKGAPYLIIMLAWPMLFSLNVLLISIYMPHAWLLRIILRESPDFPKNRLKGGMISKSGTQGQAYLLLYTSSNLVPICREIEYSPRFSSSAGEETPSRSALFFPHHGIKIAAATTKTQLDYIDSISHMPQQHEEDNSTAAATHDCHSSFFFQGDLQHGYSCHNNMKKIIVLLLPHMTATLFFLSREIIELLLLLHMTATLFFSFKATSNMAFHATTT
jgi:hypothetical protein